VLIIRHYDGVDPLRGRGYGRDLAPPVAAGHHGQMHSGTPQNPGPHHSAPPYAVVVEEKRRRNGAWHISLIQPVGGDLAEARATGQNIAFQHQPKRAERKGRREVYQLGEDSWLSHL
jgi:hypothetical protein